MISGDQIATVWWSCQPTIVKTIIYVLHKHCEIHGFGIFLRVKMKIHFYENQVINKSASVIKTYKSISRPHIMLTRYSVVQKAK